MTGKLIAIFDKNTREFMTRFFYPEADDDVIPYMPSEKVEKLVNSLVKRKDLSIEKQFPSLLKLGGGCLTNAVSPERETSVSLFL